MVVGELTIQKQECKSGDHQKLIAPTMRGGGDLH